MLKLITPSPLCGGVFDWDRLIAILADLDAQAQSSALWDDPSSAQKLMKQREGIQRKVSRVVDLENEASEINDYLALVEAENDPATTVEATALLDNLVQRVERQRLETLLSGEADENSCFLEVHAGAGGTEAQDWTEMLQRMYMRWGERRGLSVRTVDYVPGDGAGVKSVTMEIQGFQAYGWLKSEKGVHRLVRISPFDSNSRRHTSFASVNVFPIVDDNINIVIEDKDLRIDTYRASGAGGQHINTTDSAVRITHIPTNLVVQCQNDRSQHRNKAEAMTMLKSKLFEHEMRIREEKAQQGQASKTDMGWGNQIRSYVLHPYQMVKDLRTAVETAQTQAVLDGDIDMFLEAALAQITGEKA